MSPLYLTRFNSIYNQAVGTWGFIGQAQHNGVESVYTEAKKPVQPGVFETVLQTLATLALGFAASVLGSRLQQAIEVKVQQRALARNEDEWRKQLAEFGVDDPKEIATELAHWKETQGAALDLIQAQAKEAAVIWAKAANDSFKDAVKGLVGPRVQQLLKSRKLPIDAFFEAQKHSVNLAAAAASKQAEGNRTAILALYGTHPIVPLMLATVLRESLDQQLKSAEEIQKQETLRRWLQYQAQSRLGVVGLPAAAAGAGVPKGPSTPSATAPSEPAEPVAKVEGLVKEGAPREVPGVLFVDAELTEEQRPIEGLPVPVYEQQLVVHPLKGRMRGLSTAMLASIEETPIRNLGLPIVYRVAAPATPGQRPIEFGGGSTADRGVVLPGTASSLYHFTVAVDEAGSAQASALVPHQEKQLAAIGGPAGLHRRLGGNTPVGLQVKPDKQ